MSLRLREMFGPCTLYKNRHFKELLKKVVWDNGLFGEKKKKNHNSITEKRKMSIKRLKNQKRKLSSKWIY